MKKNLIINGQSVSVSNYLKNQNEVSFDFNGKHYHFHVATQDHTTFKVNNVLNAHTHQFIKSGNYLFSEGKEFYITGENRSRSQKKAALPGSMVSPMPGKILKILVTEGENVLAGTPLLVMEAMKMEHTIKASSDGVIEKIYYKVGDQITGGVDLVQIQVKV
ncbi:MAG: hypothetical protein L6Q33_14250 [Bacteriovoracaceae bacterium]|jgi:acetyl/propionyl-CoA carboxylase alpha subunit|nr:hypothetical protein [Bacteriovoracaceae bacterium]